MSQKKPVQDVENARVILADLVFKIARDMTDAHPEHWKHEGDVDDDAMRRTIVATMNQHGWLDSVPGVLPHIQAMLTASEVAVFSTFNDLPPADVSSVKSAPQSWWMSAADAEKVFARLQPRRATCDEDDSSGAQRVVAPVQRGAAHAAKVLETLRALKFDPRALPQSARGKTSPAKAAARKALSEMTDAVFKKAWQALLDSGEIVNS